MLACTCIQAFCDLLSRGSSVWSHSTVNGQQSKNTKDTAWDVAHHKCDLRVIYSGALRLDACLALKGREQLPLVFWAVMMRQSDHSKGSFGADSYCLGTVCSRSLAYQTVLTPDAPLADCYLCALLIACLQARHILFLSIGFLCLLSHATALACRRVCAPLWLLTKGSPVKCERW